MYGKIMMKGGTKPKNPIISNAEKALMDNKFYQKATAAVDGRTNSSFMKGGAAKIKMKTGGMVNSNAKLSADNTPGSKGVKSGTNPKASASKKAKGRPAKSTSPKKANP